MLRQAFELGRCLCVVVVICATATEAGASALRPATTGGVESVDRAFAALSNHLRLMVVGAHPDDEDTTLLTYVRRGLDGESAYLSLSRGEGGQNLIGPELGVGLGLVRTGELEAAREVEGASQFFTRAYDFGYTRSLDETFQRWPRAQLLEDAVRVVRRFKPQIVVAVFPGDSQAGHGQHQASGVIAAEVIEASGLPDKYPGLTAEGLPPWQPEAFYRSFWWSPDDITARYAFDAVDPYSGKSIYQIAAASRSMHRSQDMGTLQRIGRIEGGVGWESGSAGQNDTELFESIDTRLSAIAGYLDAGDLQTEALSVLADIEQEARRARISLTPYDLDAAVPILAELVSRLDRLWQSVDRATPKIGGAEIVAPLLAEKLRLASEGLVSAAGVTVDATANRPTVSPGGALTIKAMAWNSGSRSVSVSSVELMTDHHWRVVEERVPEPRPRISGIEALEIDVGVDRMAEPTIPYYLEEPLRGDMYSWPEAATGYLGLPRRQPPLRVQFRIRVEDVEVDIDREVVYLERDQAVGEVRSPIRVVPALEVELQPGLILWPLNDSSPRRLEVTLRSNSDEPLHGSLEFQTDGPWSGLESRDFRLSATASSKAVTATLGRSREIESGLSAVRAVARLEGGEEYEFSYPLVSYPHIRSRPIPRRASAEIRALDLRLPDLGEIGYIRGASDRVPEVLEEIGLQVELLTSDLLESGELSRFGAIVVGSRAYEVDAALRRAHSRLLDYVRAGGLLLVQYQQYQFVEGGFAPFPMEIARPHGRVTDEKSPVEILEPDHLALNHPNRLTEEDWQNWVQERGLYFASSWDPKFLPILSLRDSDQPEQRGSLLIAEVDRGVYIYTGLSFFRELPAGVPGALRLFSNLLALGES